MRTHPDIGLPPTILATKNSKKWPKNYVHFGLYCRVYRWNRTKLFRANRCTPRPLLRKICRPKTSFLRHDFWQLCDLIANISTLKRVIVNQKTALQTTIIPVHGDLIWRTLVKKRWKIRTKFWRTQNKLFSDVHISGDKRRFLLKILHYY